MTHSRTRRINIDKVLCLSLFSLIVLLVTLYMYLVSAAIVHVVIRKEVNQELVTLNSEIGKLESQYIESQHRVSDQIASLQGYQEISKKVFIDRTPSSLVLSNSPR